MSRRPSSPWAYSSGWNWRALWRSRPGCCCWLNSKEARLLADTITGINRSGTTIVMIEHNLGEVLRVCQRLVVLDNGKKIADGEPAAVMNNATVRAAYLGPGVIATAEEQHAAA